MTHAHGHAHTHGLVDASIKRSHAGLRVVGVSLAVLAATALAQTAIYLVTDSVALLADLIHNAGDALTAVPLAVERLIDPVAPDAPLALALAGLVGIAGNELAARIRLRGGRRLDSAALIADGNHARTDALVSGGVVVSAAAVALGAPVIDAIAGLAISALILRVTWQSWRTVRGHRH